MARELMPKSGIMMPYVVVTRDAAIVGVSTVDGFAGTIDLTQKYLKISDAANTYLNKTEGATKAYVGQALAPIMEGALFKDDPYVNNNTPIRSGGANGVESVDMIKVTDANIIKIGSYESSVQGIELHSAGRVSVVDRNAGGIETKYPIYSQRYRPEITELPFAAIGSYVKDAQGRTIGVNRTGVNADITQMTQKVIFTQAPTVPDAAQPYDAVNLRQLQAAGGGGGANMSGVMNNFIGAVEWFNGSRASLPAGYIAADGQVLSRVRYPDLSAALEKGMLNSVTEAMWINSGDSGRPFAWRSSFSRGGTAGTSHDGSTPDAWMRAPDLNGIQANSIKHLFLSGSSGAASEPSVGQVWTQSSPNLSGRIAPGSNVSGTWLAPTKINGTENEALTAGPDIVNMNRLTDGSLVNQQTPLPNYIDFNANRQNKTYGRGSQIQTSTGGAPVSRSPDNIGDLYPNHAVGIWIIRANGSFTAANTSYNVINSDTALPAPGIAIEGGLVRSVYKINDTEHMSAQFSIRRGVGQTPFARIALKGEGHGSDTVYDLPLNNKYNPIQSAAMRNVVSFNQVNVPTPADVMLQNALDFRAIQPYALPASYPMGVTSSLMRGDQGWGRENQAILGVLTSKNWPDASGDNSCFQIACNEQAGLVYKKPLYSAGASATYLSDFITVRDSRNTTVDGNGFIKQASPIVKLFGDGKYETNDEAKGARAHRISEGVYKVEKVLGFNSDTSWSGMGGGFELPQNGNGLALIWLDFEVEADGSIIIKTYHRTHPTAPSFASNEIEGYKEADPIDIPKGRWVDLRVEMPTRED